MGKLFRKSLIRTDIESCWAFFSSPTNLSKITPKDMSFVIKKFDGQFMYEGQKIEYLLKPIFGIPFTWITLIESVKINSEFVDRQVKGPYKIWHHRHIFKETKEGIEMIDMVHYKLPLGIFGKLTEIIFVNKKIKKIFDYRELVIQKYFAEN